MQLPARHPLSFESFVLFLFCYFWLRCFSLNVNWFLLSWRHEDVCRDVCDQVLLRFRPLHFLQLFHHLLLTHSGCRCQSYLSSVLGQKLNTFNLTNCGSKLTLTVALTGCIFYHIRGLKAWVLVKCGAPKAALENLDEVENKARADLH